MLTISCALLALAACSKPAGHENQEAQANLPAGLVKGADRSHRGEAMPAAPFNDPSGQAISLNNFKGKPTLVNLWASWCAPCVKELPTLDRLVRSSGARFNLVAISQDAGPHPSVEAFLRAHQVRTLASYQDPKMAMSGALRADTLPTSILYDAQGREVWRYVGQLDWTGPDAARLLAEARI